MSFDDIPEDAKECFPCPDQYCNGSVSSNDGIVWECDTCNFNETAK